jgi:hypothetical protein
MNLVRPVHQVRLVLGAALLSFGLIGVVSADDAASLRLEWTIKVVGK